MHDTWDFEAPSAPPPQDSWSFPDGNQDSGGAGIEAGMAASLGLSDCGMGKGKGGEPKKDWDTWDTWDTGPSSGPGGTDGNSSFGGGGNSFDSPMTGPGSFNQQMQPPLSPMGPPGSNFGSPGDFDPGGKGSLWSPPDFGGPPDMGKGLDDFGKGPGDFGKGPGDFGKGPGDFGKGPDFGSGPPPDFAMGPGEFGKGPGDFGGKGPGDFGKGMDDFGTGPGDFGKGPGDFGKGPMDFGKGPSDFGSGPGDFGKGQDDFGKGSWDMSKGDFGKGFAPDDFGKGTGTTMFDGCKGKGEFGKGPDDFGKGLGKSDFSGPGLRPSIIQPPPMMGKGFTQPAKGVSTFAPPGSKSAVLAPPRNPLLLGKGPMGKGFDGRPLAPVPPRPGFAQGVHVPPPPPGAPSAPGMMGGSFPKPPGMPNFPQQFAPGGPQPPSGLAPELLALTEAEEVHNDMGLKVVPGQAIEKKPRLFLLVTRLAPELQEAHMQQVLEQCGEVQAWRRGQGTNGEPLSFGFVQFGDPEAAWKASTCLAKQVLCGQEIKVLVEEQAESVIQQWRDSQKVALKVNSDEELEFELERKSVFCKALIEAKVEEIYGPSEGGGGAMVRRREELREREQARITRVRKRKAWRESEFAKELARVESREKRLRRDERDRDDFDRGREQAEHREKDDTDLKGIAKKEEIGNTNTGPLAITYPADDQRALADMVDRIQAQSLQDLFKLELDVPFLRNEKTFERKLRPWLERKIDLCMGGPQSDLVEYVLRKVNSSSTADSLISDLQRYLDDNAASLVERMWRMLVFELMRNGLTLKKPVKEELLM